MFVQLALLTHPEMATCTKILCIFVHILQKKCAIIKTVKGKEMIIMLKAYRVYYKLTMEKANEDFYKFSEIFLEEESNEDIQTFEGKTFQSYWDLHEKFGVILPSNRWNRTVFSKKRRIEFFLDYTPAWVDNGKDERAWTFEVMKVEEPKMSMTQLFKLPAEQVIQYLKERGIDKI